MGGRGSVSGSGAVAAKGVGELSDRQLASEKERLQKESDALANRMRALQPTFMSPGAPDQDPSGRAKWDAARKSRQRITDRIGDIESEQLRREHESPEYKEAARFAEGQRKMREKASARAAQVTSLAWEAERRRRLRDAKSIGLFGKS